MEERSRHGKTFDEIDLFDMQEKCRITGMTNPINSLKITIVITNDVRSSL